MARQSWKVISKKNGLALAGTLAQDLMETNTEEDENELSGRLCGGKWWTRKVDIKIGIL